MGSTCLSGVQVQHDAIDTDVVLYGRRDSSPKALGIKGINDNSTSSSDAASSEEIHDE